MCSQVALLGTADHGWVTLHLPWAAVAAGAAAGDNGAADGAATSGEGVPPPPPPPDEVSIEISASSLVQRWHDGVSGSGLIHHSERNNRYLQSNRLT